MESQIMEWSQGMGKRLKEYFRSRESRRRMTGEWDVAISVGATLFMVTVRNGRFLKEKEYILSGEGEASLAEALCRAEKDGFRHRKLLWLMNEPDLRCVCRKFPNMTEPELEENRLFGSEPVQSGYHILSYTPEGYEVLVSAIRKETGDRLAAAAEKAGRVIAWGFLHRTCFGYGRGTGHGSWCWAVHPGDRYLLQVQKMPGGQSSFASRRIRHRCWQNLRPV